MVEVVPLLAGVIVFVVVGLGVWAAGMYVIDRM